MKHRELATVSNCLVCDSFFIIVVDTIASASVYPGRKGTIQFENDLEKIQIKHFKPLNSKTNSNNSNSNNSTSCNYKEQENENEVFEDTIEYEYEYEAFRINTNININSNNIKKESVIDANPNSNPKSVLNSTKSVKKGKPRQTHNTKSNSNANVNAPPDSIYINRVVFLPCPTCAEQLSGSRYSEYIQSDGDTVLSPCVYHSWVNEPDEPIVLPALYVDSTATANSSNSSSTGRSPKPKWNLVSGIGPQVLEMDSSRSGRVYKPSLRGFITGSSGLNSGSSGMNSGSSGTNRCIPFDRYVEEGLEGVDVRPYITKCHEKLCNLWKMLCICNICGQDGGSSSCGSSSCIEHYDYHRNKNTNNTNTNTNSTNTNTAIGIIPYNTLHFVTEQVYTSYVEVCRNHVPLLDPKNWEVVVVLLSRYGIGIG